MTCPADLARAQIEIATGVWLVVRGATCKTLSKDGDLRDATCVRTATSLDAIVDGVRTAVRIIDGCYYTGGEPFVRVRGARVDSVHGAPHRGSREAGIGRSRPLVESRAQRPSRPDRRRGVLSRHLLAGA